MIHISKLKSLRNPVVKKAVLFLLGFPVFFDHKTMNIFKKTVSPNVMGTCCLVAYVVVIHTLICWVVYLPQDYELPKGRY